MRYIKTYEMFEPQTNEVHEEPKCTISIEGDKSSGIIELKCSDDIASGSAKYNIILNYKESKDVNVLNKNIIHISSTNVEKGKGSIFMDLIVDHAKKLKLDAVVLDALSDDEKTMKLYNKFGFTKLNDQSMRVYKEL